MERRSITGAASKAKDKERGRFSSMEGVTIEENGDTPRIGAPRKTLEQRCREHGPDVLSPEH